jgi:hypothetical protein
MCIQDMSAAGIACREGKSIVQVCIENPDAEGCPPPTCPPGQRTLGGGCCPGGQHPGPVDACVPDCPAGQHNDVGGECVPDVPPPPPPCVGPNVRCPPPTESAGNQTQPTGDGSQTAQLLGQENITQPAGPAAELPSNIIVTTTPAGPAELPSNITVTTTQPIPSIE